MIQLNIILIYIWLKSLSKLVQHFVYFQFFLLKNQKEEFNFMSIIKN